ncbi:MAG: hypothetical protein JO266_22020 [Acidobacteria bacterium]|nr:hypothetical protein [Acidobacteriota bacterium]MBV9479833.1 hypothetical protein [Acidobacteriota bacterium]
MRAGGDGLRESGQKEVDAAVSIRVSTSATPVSRAAQTAPMIPARCGIAGYGLVMHR